MTFNPNRYEYPYGIHLLDDIHNILPELMYDTQMFASNPLIVLLQSRVQEMFEEEYVRNRTMYRMYQQTRRRRNSQNLYQTQPPLIPQPSTPPLVPQTSIPSVVPQTIPISRSQTTGRNQIHITSRTIPLTTQSIQSLLNSSIDLEGTGDMLGSLLRLAMIGLPGESDIPENLTPVPIRPTQEEIDAATFLSSIERPADIICPICQSHDLENNSSPTWRYIRHCNHQFHKECIDHWFQENVHCPVCRFDIREYQRDTSSMGI